MTEQNKHPKDVGVLFYEYLGERRFIHPNGGYTLKMEGYDCDPRYMR